MPLTKSKGNMYDWVTHTHTHVRGKCPFGCEYCYVQAMERRFGGGRYSGNVELVEKELDVNYGSGNTIFLEHCCDIATYDPSIVVNILAHCHKYPNNRYVFQSKDPMRFSGWLQLAPRNSVFGCTIETNRDTGSKATPASERARGMRELAMNQHETFITIEPILAFDVLPFADMIHQAFPLWVNIGADSKGTGLDEPSGEDVLALIQELNKRGVTIRKKVNLERLIGDA